jgi:transglutaminase-like putative cysteine protease
MRSDRAALLLNMLLILVSAGAHQAGAEEFAFFLLTVVLCIVVWLREKAGRPLLLNDTIGTVICLIAFVALMWRGVSTGASGGYRMADVGIAPVGDFLIVFEWVTLCRRRKGHDYFWMYLVTLVLMGTAGLQMPGLLYGFFFIAYAFLAICALAAGHVAREARLAYGDAGSAVPIGGPAAEPAAGQPILAARRLYPRALAAMLPILLLVGTLFVILPRTAATGTIAPAILPLGQQPTSGFSTTVQLGAVGQIQGNTAPVMHVIVRDPNSGESIRVSSLLLRGLPLDAYVLDHGVWSWQFTRRRGDRPTAEPYGFDSIYPANFPGYSEAPYREITCDISLEPLDTPLLFAPFAPESISTARHISIGIHPLTFVLESSVQNRRTLLNYTVTSRLFDPGPPPEAPPRTLPEAALSPYLALPSDLSPRIRALAREIAPASVRTDYEKAERILNYFADSDRFTYTTDMNPTPGVEPVEDFLFNLKRGHCEYFASSMVLLLREVNVPARLVNGFKLSEWNPLAGAYIVRQEHAHSWVEAYLRPYGWRTLDPTAVSRDAATPKPMLAGRIGANLYDWINSLWVTYVLNFDSEHQAAPSGWLVKIAGLLRRFSTAKQVGVHLEPGGAELPIEENGPIHAILIAIRWIAAALAGAGLLWVMARSVGRFQRRRRPAREFQYYLRMERLLRRRGFQRTDAQTPWEFSAAVAERRWPAASQVAAITERFCRARYGASRLTVADLAEIEQALGVIRRTKERNRR